MIIGSFSKDKIIELCELAKPRNTYCHSISTYDVDNCSMFSVLRSYGDINYNKLNDNSNFYSIVFLQSTPCDRSIQPPYRGELEDGTNYQEYWLWFDGKLNQNDIKRIQLEESTTESWEPMLLLKHVIRYGEPADLWGGFSCVYSNGRELFVFRNEQVPMFFDSKLNMCTTPFKDSVTTASNRVLKLLLDKKKLKIISEFETTRDWS